MAKSKKIPAYLDESLSFEERAADLVSRMTLEEKASQLKNEAAAIPRLGVSAYNYWREALHGVARQGKATSFPTSLSMSNTWNPDLVRRAAEITSTEARGKNSRTDLSYWSPTVNMARDPRWGRNEETYGEDPYLSGRLGSEFVKGMQGDDKKYIKTIATVKHFVANNVEKERRMGTSVMSERTLRDYYARVFQNIVESAAPASAMSSYNATTIYRCGKPLYDYVPATANPYILKDLLRRTWGFKGYVTGDCGAFGDLNNTAAYKTVLFPGKDINGVPQSAATVKGFQSGADTDCGYSASAGSVLEAVKNGSITEDELNINIYNLFLQRMRTGEFDKNPTYREITSDVLETPEHTAVAEEAAEQSWVLLKNDGILPLKNIKSAALVGALADEIVLGDYSGSPEHTVTPLEGISAEFKKACPGAELKYLGGATDDTPLMNIRGMRLLLKNGGIREIDLGAARAEGMESADGGFFGVTRKGAALIPSVDFRDVVSVEADIEPLAGGRAKLYYGFGGPRVAELKASDPKGGYTGEAGGYCETADLYIEFEAEAGMFSVDKYRKELDEADVIIAYAGTTLSDSAEFNDRGSIALPESQAHVRALTEAYPEKTVVALQTVGQIDVEPFEKGARAILWTSYNGQTQGTAVGRVLCGAVNPSGRLTTTWYKNSDLEKMPVGVKGTVGEDGITRYYNNYEIKPDDKKDFPGRTYRYYKNTPIYPFGFGLSYTKFEYKNLRLSSAAAVADGEIEALVDVTNTGGVFGMETVQFYAGFPNIEGMPKICLAGFEKLALGPGETKTAAAKISMRDLRFFDEATQKTVVHPGKYKIYAAKNSSDRSLSAEFEITSGITPTLKTVAALPSGVTVRGLVSGDKVETVTSVRAGLSAALTDESFIELNKTNTKYKSDNEDIARTEADGTVLPGPRGGVTMITAAVTFGGETKSAQFPIVNIPELKADEKSKAEAEAKLRAARSGLRAEAYSENNLKLLDEIFSKGAAQIKGAVKLDEMSAALERALRGLKNVEPDRLEMSLAVEAVGAKNGVIESRGEYALIAKDGAGARIGAAWSIEDLSGSNRKAVELKGNSLIALGCGLVRVRAVDIENLRRGESLIYINLPIEAETADNGGGADLTARDCGTESGGYAASSGARVLKYCGLKIENLKEVCLRYRLGGPAAAVRLMSGGAVIAEGIAEPAENWSEITLKANPAAIRKRGADFNGLADIGLASGGADIDKFKMIYEKTDADAPYKIAAAECGDEGKVIAYVNYVGVGEPKSDTLRCGGKTAPVLGGGIYEIEAGAKEGEEIILGLCGAETKLRYSAPKPARRVIYSASDPAYAALFDTGGAVKLPEINGLTGYGPLKYHTCTEYDFETGGEKLKFTRDWQGGEGGEDRACLFFTPEAPCRVTVIFDGGEDREQHIVQNGVRLASGLSRPGHKTAVSAETADTTAPVYTYGGGANKSVYAVIVDYRGGAEPKQKTIQSLGADIGFARLDRSENGDEKIYLSDTGRQWSEVDLSVLGFDEPPKICGIAAYKDRLYAGCGGGEVIIITDCPKCRKRKKVCDFDIKSIEITDGIITLRGYGADEIKEISMTAMGADQISIDEAMALIAGGAAAIDVREREVFKAEPTRIEGSVNVPLNELQKISTYGRGTKIVFCCSRGIWSAEAVLRAKEMGFENVYYLV